MVALFYFPAATHDGGGEVRALGMRGMYVGFRHRKSFTVKSFRVEYPVCARRQATRKSFP